MAGLYADENVPLPVVEELRRLGHDVLTMLDDGKANQRYPDASVLRDATTLGRVWDGYANLHGRRQAMRIERERESSRPASAASR